MQVSPVPLAMRPSRVDRINALLARCRSQPRWPDLLVALVLAAPVPVIMALMPFVAQNYTFHDVFIPLDAAWRTLQGQWPHTDYYTPLGLSYVGLHGAAAWLWGMDSRLVIRANLIALPLVVGPALLLAWRRLNVLSMVMLTVLLATLIMSPVFLDGPERVIAQLANYNRIGGGLCAVVCLWALCRPKRRSAALDVVEVIALALVFLILLYLKVTFFALAAATTLVGLCTVRGLWRGAAVVGVLVVAGAIMLELLHPGLNAAYLADLRRAGAANTQLFRGFYTSQALIANLVPCLLIVAMGALAAWVAREQRWPILGIFVVAGGSILVSTQNFGAFSAPVIVLVMLLAQRLEANLVPAGASPLSTPSLPANPVLAGIGLAAVMLATVPFLLTHFVGTVYQATLRPANGVVVSDSRFDALHKLIWFGNPIERGWVPDEYTFAEAARWKAVLPVTVAVAVLNDGLDLLARDGLTQQRIANLSFDNPFPAALHAPPPRGVALWWDENRTFTTDKLSPDMVLGDADVVMVPKLWWDELIATTLLGVVHARLVQDFIPHESRYWTAWVRKPTAPAS